MQLDVLNVIGFPSHLRLQCGCIPHALVHTHTHTPSLFRYSPFFSAGAAQTAPPRAVCSFRMEQAVVNFHSSREAGGITEPHSSLRRTERHCVGGGRVRGCAHLWPRTCHCSETKTIPGQNKQTPRRDNKGEGELPIESTWVKKKWWRDSRAQANRVRFFFVLLRVAFKFCGPPCGARVALRGTRVSQARSPSQPGSLRAGRGFSREGARVPGQRLQREDLEIPFADSDSREIAAKNHAPN